MPKSEKGDDTFITAGSQPSVLLPAAKKALGFVTVAVIFNVQRGRIHAVEVTGNDPGDALSAQKVRLASLL